MAIIEIKHLTKEYRLGQNYSFKHSALQFLGRFRGVPAEERPRFKALDDVNFSVDEGEVLGVIGTNGAGKSTLLKMLARISVPTSGSVAVRGTVAPLIEVGAGLIPDLTGRENIFLNGSILGMSREAVHRKFDEIVQFAELEQFIDTPIKRYSSGMKVRLGFAVATSVDADILIVDEVLAVGDLAFQRKCFDRMEDLIKRRRKTVLLVSHNIRQVERLCDRALLMDCGKIALDDSASSVCNTFYERSDEKIARHLIANKSNIRTTGEVELLELYLTNARGERVDDIVHGLEMRVVIRIATKRALRLPTFVFGIHTTDFVYITTTSSPRSAVDPVLSVGTHEVVLSVPEVPLLPGAYAARLSIDVEDPVKNIFYAENLLHFLVRGYGVQRTSTDCEGFFPLDAAWESRTVLSDTRLAKDSSSMS